jgi:hypothetical protein
MKRIRDAIVTAFWATVFMFALALLTAFGKDVDPFED